MERTTRYDGLLAAMPVPVVVALSLFVVPPE